MVFAALAYFIIFLSSRLSYTRYDKMREAKTNLFRATLIYLVVIDLWITERHLGRTEFVSTNSIIILVIVDDADFYS